MKMTKTMTKHEPDSAVTYTVHGNALRIDVNDSTVSIYTDRGLEVIPADKLPLCGELVSVTVANGRVVDYYSRPQEGEFFIVIAALMILGGIATKAKDWAVVGLIALIIGLILTCLAL
jgi:hypothetical protein